MHTGKPVRVQMTGVLTSGKPSRRQLKPSKLKTLNQRHLKPDEGEQMTGLPTGYTSEEVVDGRRTKIPNIERMKCIGGGIAVRQVSPILAGLASEHTQVHPHVKPHSGPHADKMAAWLIDGPLPIPPETPQDTYS